MTGAPPKVDRAGFRLRSPSASRLEGFSDCVFGLALTFLVLSLSPPTNTGELRAVMGDALPFGLCFLSLMHVWASHHSFFRRFGLDDGVIHVLNGVLLFTVLVYVYPLKFLLTVFCRMVFGVGGSAIKPAGPGPVLAGDAAWMFGVYGLGFVAVFGVLASMNVHAWRRREELALTPLERHLTREAIGGHLIMAGVAGASAITAAVLPEPQIHWCGWMYFLIGPAKAIFHSRMGARRPSPSA